LSLLFGASIGSKKALGLALLAYHVPVAVMLGLKVQAAPKLLEQVAPVLGAHSLLAVLFLLGSLFSRDASSAVAAKKKKKA
jgi:ABC-type transport system involved in cytochrome c biogenesis permease component